MYVHLCVLSKKEIIEKISQDNNYLNIAIAVAKNNLLYKDLFQDGLIVLLEMDDKKLKAIYKKNQLKYYFFGVLRMLQRQGNKRKISTIDFSVLDLPDSISEASDMPPELQQIIDSEVDVLLEESYGKALLKLIVDMGSEAEVSRKTGITQQSIHYVVGNTKKALKKKYGN